MSDRSTPPSSSALSAPFKSRVVMPPLKRPHTIPTRTPRPDFEPSRYSPTRLRSASTTPASNSVSLLDVIEAPKHVTHALTLGAQVINVEFSRH